jgi:CHAT domain-containing protein
VQVGATCVVASLWPVFDDAAFLISKKFYELHLDPSGNERLAPAAALRSAQDWLRHLKFHDLKQLFPVQGGPGGAYLVLYATSHVDTLGLSAELIRELRLPVGDDDACPFAEPH